MVDFNDLVDDDESIDYTQFKEVFDSLDPETTHTELRPSQLDALELLQDKREEKDIILKVSTGAGKTTIGLLYLYSHMKEKERPAVYLCPTVQLVKQVIDEASRLGMSAVDYPKGEPHPPLSGTAAKSIIVCTYDKLFNAKSTFNRSDVQLQPCAIVLDDAHAGIERIKKAYTVTLSNQNSLFEQVFSKLKGSLEVKYKSVVETIEAEDPNSIFEIPFWIWKNTYEEIRSLFNKSPSDDELKFTYPNIRNHLRWCRCVITGTGLEIQPRVLPVDNSPAFDNCDHRLFMSATLSEDSVIVRDLGCSMEAALFPLRPVSDKGLGERMVIAPSLIHPSFNREWVMKLAKKMSSDYNVVALCSREEEAKEWGKYGAQVALGDNVESVVEELKDKESDTSFAVFAQRYDGVDLADRACRILILDGLPRGESIIERHDYEKSIYSHGSQNKIIYKIEQGMGRSVRSHVDYSVVILTGPEIGHYVAKHEVQGKMSADTQAQLKLSLKLVETAISKETANSEEIKKREAAIKDMIEKCLNRDVGWKKFYNKNVRDKNQGKVVSPDKNLIELAQVERKAFLLAEGNQYIDASKLIRDSLNKVTVDERVYGWSLSTAANYLLETDPGEAMEIQTSAHFKNKAVQPPHNIIYKSKKLEAANFCEKILTWIKGFDEINGVSVAINSLKTDIDFTNGHRRVERAVNDLAEMLGAVGERPEVEYQDGGPDNLWFWNNYAIIIEVKNEKTSSLFKEDAAQLSHSVNWFKERHPNLKDIITLTITDAKTLTKEASYPEGTLVLDQDGINRLIQDLGNFYENIIRSVVLTLNASDVLGKAKSHGITPDLFFKKYAFEISKLKRVK